MSEIDKKIMHGMEPNEYGGGIKGHAVPVIHNSSLLVSAAEIAREMAARWGCVAAEPDGEDSAGRSRMRLATPDEVAARACNTAAALWAEFEARGWIVSIPDPAPVSKKAMSTAD